MTKGHCHRCQNPIVQDPKGNVYDRLDVLVAAHRGAPNYLTPRVAYVKHVCPTTSDERLRALKVTLRELGAEP